MVKRIIGNILIAVGIIIYLFFRNYNGELIPYPTVLRFFGIALVILGVISIIKSKTKSEINYDSKVNDEILGLKKNGEKIIVNLNDCEIKTNSYIKEIEKNASYKTQTLDSLYDNNRNIQQINVNQAILRFERQVNGQVEEFLSPTIFKDVITLRFLLDNKKETIIYVDKVNRKKYYFDLEFIND